MKRVLIIGNSDGIGLATTKALLREGWQVTGLSRSPSSVSQPSYDHIMVDVQSDDYSPILESLLSSAEPYDLCLYCVGIGEPLDFDNMTGEIGIFDVNLMGLVKTTSLVISYFVKRGTGHFIGLSSLADELLSREAPSYHASKAGFSNYLESLALSLRPKGIYVTNVRFGFVDTKMAKGDHPQPFKISAEKAAERLLQCLDRKPIRFSVPRRAAMVVRLLNWLTGLRLLFS